MSIRKSCLAAAVLAVLAALPLCASPLPLPLPQISSQLAARSPHVVVAVVEDARGVWNAGHTLIVTEYELRIEDRLKGDAPERVTLTVPGGTVGEETHVRGTVRAGDFRNLALGGVRLPASVPAGTYYFVFVLDVPEDGYPANNRAWSNPDVKIAVRR